MTARIFSHSDRACNLVDRKLLTEKLLTEIKKQGDPKDLYFSVSHFCQPLFCQQCSYSHDPHRGSLRRLSCFIIAPLYHPELHDNHHRAPAHFRKGVTVCSSFN